SIPIVALFEKELKSKTILMGFGLDSDAIHSPNEHYGVFNYLKGIETIPLFYKYRSEEHTSELQSRENLVCRLLLEKKNTIYGYSPRRNLYSRGDRARGLASPCAHLACSALRVLAFTACMFSRRLAYLFQHPIQVSH